MDMTRHYKDYSSADDCRTWWLNSPTLAVIKRETNSWKQVFISAGYLFALAYLASFITYQLARMWL